MKCNELSAFVLSFPNTIAAPHFDRTAFKVVNKRIFATLHQESQTVNVKLSPADQSVYCLVDKKTIYRVDNKWGLQGWTTFEIAHVDTQVLQDALITAYEEVFKTGKK